MSRLLFQLVGKIRPKVMCVGVGRPCVRGGGRIPTGASRREASTLGVRPRNDTALAGVRENALIKPLDFVQNHDFFREILLTLAPAYAIISNCAGIAREVLLCVDRR